MKQRILILDNYDSFTYNLVQIVEKITSTEIDVIRNDQLSIEDIAAYDTIILSPGPGIPEEAGLLLPIIKRYAPQKKILGVCLGHQAIGEAFGARLRNLDQVYHGIATPIMLTKHSDQDPIIGNLGDSFEAGRYHSWVIEKGTLPKDFVVTCEDDRGEIMGLRHIEYKLYGVQFHPESILTPNGKTIIENFLNIV